MERQYLGQAPELAGGAIAAMHQDIDRLTGIQTQTPVWIVGARPEAGNAEGHVRSWQTACINLEIGRVERLPRGTAAEQG